MLHYSPSDAGTNQRSDAGSDVSSTDGQYVCTNECTNDIHTDWQADRCTDKRTNSFL